MPGAFEVAAELDHDPLATAEEIQRSGEGALRWLEALATAADPRPIDLQLVQDIHRRWFETTFPADAGRHRTQMVLNRKGTAVEVDAILPAVHGACADWNWRREHTRPTQDTELVEFVVAEADALTVRIHDVHPFIDGNTRTTWHLRNYLLMLDGLRPLTDLDDYERYETAWWDATVEDHDALDPAVLSELAAQ